MAHIDGTARISASVINRYIRRRIEPIYRSSVLMEEMKSRGRITFNADSDQQEWRPRFRRREITASDGNIVSLSFPQTNTKGKAYLPYRAYDLPESVTKFEKLASQNSETAIFKIFEDALDEMADDFIESFRLKLYLDGTANPKDIHGLESWFSVSGTVTNSPVGDPNDSYANNSTALGVRGDWTAPSGKGWPVGTGDTEYCWWSPLVVDYGNSEFAGTTNSWSNQWQQACRFLKDYMMHLQGVEPDMFLLNTELFREARDSLRSIQQLDVLPKARPADIGPSELLFDGTRFKTEYGVPANVGYALVFDKLTLKSMQSQLVETTKDFDLTTKTDRLLLDFYGNLFNDSPAFQGKLEAITAEST